MGISWSSDIGTSDLNNEMCNNTRKGQGCIANSSFYNFFDNSISDDLLIEILSFVPSRDLLLNCQLVCKRWKELIDGQTVWRRKCERENIEFSNISRRLPILPRHFYRCIYLYSKSEKNLLKNSCGEDNLSSWQILKSFGDGLIIEKPPAGCDPVPPEVESESCFATSYDECAKFQVIDLYEKEHNKYLLLNNLATIKVGEWFGTRFDCGCTYGFKVDLLDHSHERIDTFNYRYKCEQWEGGKWQSVQHEFSDVNNARYIHFEHMGCDTQYWAGHYGSKFTGGFVMLCLK